MALLPGMGDTGIYRQGQSGWGAYNHNLSAQGLDVYEAENMTLKHAPVLCSRAGRGRVRAFEAFGGMAGGDGLIWVDGTGLYVKGVPVGQVTGGPKRIVRMGGRAIIFPDKVMYDEATGSMSSLAASVSATASLALCGMDGSAYGGLSSASTPPESPENGAHWLDTSGAEDRLMVYSAATGGWSQVAATYVKIGAPGLGAPFRQGDGVRVTGVTDAQFARGGQDYVVASAGADWIVVAGLIGQGCSAQVTVERRVPDLEYLAVSGNRVWGCSSANHEIYACKLGDPTNWYCYQGLSTDSYAATVGGAGAFTGAAEHLGYVLFFRESSVIKVYGSRPGNYQVVDSPMAGVRAGAGDTVAAAGGTLFYLSAWGVSGYDGGLPRRVSAALGPGALAGGAAGALAGRYYASLKDEAGQWNLWVYETERGRWIREDGTQAKGFARDGEELYFVDGAGTMWSVGGTLDERYTDAGKQGEGAVRWMAESGDFGMDEPEAGYAGRVLIRLALEDGGRAEVYARYDGKGEWEKLGQIDKAGKRSHQIPTTLRRCDHFRLRVQGQGPVQLYGLEVTRG